MLVSLGGDARHRQVVDGVGFSLAGLEPARHAWVEPECMAGLTGLLESLSGFRLSVIVLLPEPGAESRRRAAAVLELVRGAMGRRLVALMAVAESPASWADLEGCEGFVQASAANQASDGLAVMALFATLMAPVMLTCSDEEDMLDAVGDASGPSRVIVAQWDGRRRLLTFGADEDRAAVENAASISLSPLWFEGKFAACRELMSQVRALLRPECDCLYHASSEFFVPGVATARACPVVLLCRPSALAGAQVTRSIHEAV